MRIKTGIHAIIKLIAGRQNIGAYGPNPPHNFILFSIPAKFPHKISIVGLHIIIMVQD